MTSPSDITFPPEHHRDSARGAIVFPALVNGQTITCVILDAAVQEHLGANGQDDLEEAFTLNRGTAENMARLVIRAGNTTENGEAVIRAEDFFPINRVIEAFDGEDISELLE